MLRDAVNITSILKPINYEQAFFPNPVEGKILSYLRGTPFIFYNIGTKCRILNPEKQLSLSPGETAGHQQPLVN